MQYLKGKTFSVNLGGSEAYRENWERVFGSKPEPEERSVPDPDAEERAKFDREIDAMLKPVVE